MIKVPRLLAVHGASSDHVWWKRMSSNVEFSNDHLQIFAHEILNTFCAGFWRSIFGEFRSRGVYTTPMVW